VQLLRRDRTTEEKMAGRDSKRRLTIALTAEIPQFTTKGIAQPQSDLRGIEWAIA
jgi:hypothetical protein